jgi:enolase
MPLYKFLGKDMGEKLPVPMMNILNGGAHAKNTVDFQEFMIMPVGAPCFKEALRMGAEVYHCLKRILEKDGKSTAVGDEGGFAPDLKDAFEVFDYLTRAVEEAGYKCGEDIVFAMDAAASELHEDNGGLYYFRGETKILKGENEIAKPDTESMVVLRSTDEMIDLYDKLCEKYPIYSIEDGLDEEDYEGWKKLTKRLGKRVQLVGDDLFVTNTTRLKDGIDNGYANSILIKLNQIGTISETIEAIKMAHNAGYTAIASHRSGETEDTTIADLAVALNTCQIKTGAPCRSDRVAKYNQLLRIEQQLMEEERAVYPGYDAFLF